MFDVFARPDLLVSVEDLHVIILIPAKNTDLTQGQISFSRRPACYNTDTKVFFLYSYHT